MTAASGIQMDLHKSADPLAYFTDGEERIKDGVKETCFIRYIGLGTNEVSYISLIRRMDQMPGRYERTDGLESRFSPEEVRQAQEEGLGFHFQDPVMEATLRFALETAVDIYQRCTAKASPSMVNNFRIKLLCWAQRYLPALYRAEQGPEAFPHFVCIGQVKRQEYLFLYFLYLTGCHVLYMNPEEDIPGLEEELKALSFLYEKPCQKLVHCQIPPFRRVGASVPSAGQTLSGRQMPPGGPAVPGRTEASAAGPSLSGPEAPGPSLSGTAPSWPAAETPAAASSAAENRRDGDDRQPGGSVVVKIPPRQRQRGQRRPEADSPFWLRQESPLRKMEYEELARLSASVVMIKVYDQAGQCFKSGSGVVISSGGYILTNCHVVSGGVSFGVQFENEEQETRTYSLIKYHTAFDLAMIRVERPCRPIVLAPPDPVVRGQQIVAIGSPLGLFNTISDGIVSGFRRIDQVSMIQFTAPISRGSSGGALLDLYGRLVGIITAGFDDGQNLNLAVDRDTIAPFAAGFLDR